MNQTITATNAPAAVGPYCHAKLAGNTLYTSGQLGLVPATGELPAVGIDREFPVQRNTLATLYKTPAFTLWAKPQRFQPDHGQDGKTIVELSGADILGLEVGARPHHSAHIECCAFGKGNLIP